MPATYARAAAARARGHCAMPLQRPGDVASSLALSVLENVLGDIAPHFDSIRTLCMLAGTCHSLRELVQSYPQLYESILQHATPMNKSTVRWLFLLPQHIPLQPLTLAQVPFAKRMECIESLPQRVRTQIIVSSSSALQRVLPRYSAAQAFSLAISKYGSMRGIAKAFHLRARRSEAQRAAWRQKQHRQLQLREARAREVESLRDELFITGTTPPVSMQPQRAGAGAYRSFAEIMYETDGSLYAMNSAYVRHQLTRIRRVMGDGFVSEFEKIASKAVNAFELLTADEKRYVLKHNIAWEYYLYNYTNYRELMRTINAAIPTEFLFPLPRTWPWVLHPTPISSDAHAAALRMQPVAIPRIAPVGGTVAAGEAPAGQEAPATQTRFTLQDLTQLYAEWQEQEIEMLPWPPPEQMRAQY